MGYIYVSYYSAMNLRLIKSGCEFTSVLNFFLSPNEFRFEMLCILRLLLVDSLAFIFRLMASGSVRLLACSTCFKEIISKSNFR